LKIGEDNAGARRRQRRHRSFALRDPRAAFQP